MASIQRVAVVGCGAIGASWAALFLAQGLTVAAFDIDPAAEKTMNTLVRNAIPVLSSLGLLKRADVKPEDIHFTTTMADALKDADFVQENGPERLEFKQKLFNEMAACLKPDAIIASSTSGITCSLIQQGMSTASHPERCIVGHPFNPPHLIPLVEVVAGSQTSNETVEKVMAFYAALGKKAIQVRKEVPGHIANRLQGAIMKEVMWMLSNGVCSIKDIDDAVAFGPGLRWGIMGPSLLFHLAGGEGGARHFADHLMTNATSQWTANEYPVTNDELKQQWVSGTMDEVDGRDFQDLAKQRDEQLVRMLNMRKEWDQYAFRARGERQKEAQK